MEGDIFLRTEILTLLPDTYHSCKFSEDREFTRTVGHVYRQLTSFISRLIVYHWKKARR